MTPDVPDLGMLRQRLVLQSPPTALDEMNEPSLLDSAWTTVGTYWAQVLPLSGKELENARQLKATTSHKVWMRNVGTVLPSWRFTFEATGRVFGVDSVFRFEERNAYLMIHCSEQLSPQ